MVTVARDYSSGAQPRVLLLRWQLHCLADQARPAVRSAIKGGLLAGRYFQRVGSSVKEDLQDLTAEAKASLDAENPESGSAKGSE
jgi:hypothetical protein